MAKFFERLSSELIEFIERQKLFFVATAPPLANGRINLSPKGMDTFRVLADDTVAYLDLTGSGNETAAHLRHDPGRRITIMLCSFDDKPLILRIYGQGQVVRPEGPAWAELSLRFPQLPGARQIIVMKISSVQTSCGFGVPEFELKQERSTLTDWASKKGADGIVEYQRLKNSRSIDGLETGIAAESETR
jgi:hypothetical protein